jgi:hypothetical protein
MNGVSKYSTTVPTTFRIIITTLSEKFGLAGCHSVDLHLRG